MRGSIIDMFVILVMIFIFAICSVVGMYILTEFSAQSEGMLASTAGLESGIATMGYLDPVMVFALFGLSIAVILGAFMIRTHPAFIIVTIFIFVFIIFISAQFSNVFIEFTAQSELAETANQFPMTLMIYNNLPVIVLLIGVIVIVVIYAKTKDGGGPL